MSGPPPVPTFTSDKISVHDMILECLKSYMSREEIVNHLWFNYQKQPIWTNTVFDNLEHENPDYFKSYYESLSFAQQSFNSEPDSRTMGTAQIFQGDTGASSSYQLPPEVAISSAGDAVIPLQPPFIGDAAAQNLPVASSIPPPDAAISNAIPLQTFLYPATAAHNFPGPSSSSQLPPAGDSMIDILKQIVSRLDQSLIKQDQSLIKQDQMLSLLTSKRQRTQQDQDDQGPDVRRQRTDSPTQ